VLPGELAGNPVARERIPAVGAESSLAGAVVLGLVVAPKFRVVRIQGVGVVLRDSNYLVS